VTAKPRPRRFHVRPEQIDGGRLTFDADEARHIGRVLRLEAGDVVTAVDGRGRAYAVRLDAIDAAGASGTIVGAERAAPESPLRITLAQGIARADAMETIIRAATELGVTAIVPVSTRRSVVQLTASRSRSRVDRWQRVAMEAAKQCNRAVIPPVAAPVDLGDLISATPAPGHLRLCCWEEEQRPLEDVLTALSAAPRHVIVLIGPEGGLDPAEVDLASQAGFAVAGLGARILRTQTAGAAVLAILQSRFGDLGTGVST
jgi:16S rRNA (uracil1498-N3)-methyltransferase